VLAWQYSNFLAGNHITQTNRASVVGPTNQFRVFC
jgi:hypothetical protein